jgi:hypothetical protein
MKKRILGKSENVGKKSEGMLKDAWALWEVKE